MQRLKVVSNSSPLIHLSRIGRLYLLQELFNEVIIPCAVYKEVVEEGMGQPGALEVKNAPWIKVLPIKNKSMKTLLMTFLDEGEAEAIILALETGAELLLIDEREGRQHAKKLGLRVAGTVGILLKAKRIGLISSVKNDIEKLKDAGFRISKDVENEILRRAGEL